MNLIHNKNKNNKNTATNSSQIEASLYVVAGWILIFVPMANNVFSLLDTAAFQTVSYDSESSEHLN